MPTYGYECKSCRHTFEVNQSMKDDPLKKCPECGKAIRRLINGGSGVIFKGGGFYVTDRSGKTSTGTGDSKTDSSKSTGSGTDASKNAAPCPGCAVSESCPKAVNS